LSIVILLFFRNFRMPLLSKLWLTEHSRLHLQRLALLSELLKIRNFIDSLHLRDLCKHLRLLHVYGRLLYLCAVHGHGISVELLLLQV
jgi:hypothetical protein